jgi:hypothetical protein
VTKLSSHASDGTDASDGTAEPTWLQRDIGAESC